MDKVTVPVIKEKKQKGEKISVITAYDYTFARLAEKSGIDIVLVGDSLGMVIQGEKDTTPVKMEHMIYHSLSVSRGLKNAHLVTDMPFMSYQISPEQALENAGILIKEGKAESVKLEGGTERFDTIKKIVSAGIPVMGHIGLTPQSVNKFGGFKVQGKSESDKKYLIESARAIEEAGAYALVLESIPWKTAKTISEKISIPTIGIGAGKYCDGQVLVIYDLLGADERFNPKFLKKYANLDEIITNSIKKYISEVKNGIFPGEENSFE